MQQLIYPPYYESYVSKVAGKNVIDYLAEQQEAFNGFLHNVPFDLHDFAYQEGKWTFKQVVAHIVDTERIMSTRLLCIARGEQQALPGYDENAYADNTKVSHRSLSSIGIEFQYLRWSNIEMITELPESDLLRVGTANGKPVQALAIAYIMAGHVEHHWEILKSRYLGIH